jgi:hypothetical protein
VITAVFEVVGGKLPLGPDVLATAWGRRHRFSYCDGRMLTLVVEQSAADRGGAFEAVLSTAERLWLEATGNTLSAPSTFRVQTVVMPQERVSAGAAGRSPDDVIGSSVGRRLARLRATRRALSELEDWGRDLSIWPDDRPGRDDPPDDGGLAGVREPRRPSPGPGGIPVALDEPGTMSVVPPTLPAHERIDERTGGQPGPAGLLGGPDGGVRRAG